MLLTNLFKRHRWAPLAAAATALVGLASPAFSEGVSRIDIVAVVPAYCQIGSPSAPTLSLVDGSAEIGAVREVCNTSGGSQVTAHFSNLSTGTLQVGGQSVAIQNGEAVLSTDKPEVQTADWRLANAQPVDPNAPVTVELSITSN
jgi:hypothetical protein